MTIMRRAGAAVVVSFTCWSAGPCLSAQSMQRPVPQESTRRYIDPDRGTSIEDLVAKALDQAPAVLAKRALVRGAQAELMQAGLRPNPAVSLDWRDEVGGKDRQSSVGISWPLDLFRRKARTAVATSGVKAAEEDANETARQLAAEVRHQAGRALAAVRQLQIREAVAAAARQTRDLIAARAQSGAAPPLERDLAEVESRRAEVELIRQRAEADTALIGLKALVGLEPSTPLRLREDLEAVVARQDGQPSAPPADQPAIARAVGARSDVRAAETDVAIAAARTELFRREGRPDVSVVGAYMRMDSGFAPLGLTPTGQPVPIRGRFHNLAIGAMVTVPWRNRNQGAVAASTATEQAARHELAARKLAAEAEIDAARLRDEQARRALDVFSGGLRDLAARNLEVMRESYLLGRASLIDVLTETRRYLDVETAHAVALFEAFESRVALALAMGVIR